MIEYMVWGCGASHPCAQCHPDTHSPFYHGFQCSQTWRYFQSFVCVCLCVAVYVCDPDATSRDQFVYVYMFTPDATSRAQYVYVYMFASDTASRAQRVYVYRFAPDADFRDICCGDVIPMTLIP